MISARTPKHMAVATMATQLARNRCPRRTPRGSTFDICPDPSPSAAAHQSVGDGCGTATIVEGRKQDSISRPRIAVPGNELEYVPESVLEGVRPSFVVPARQSRILAR